MRGSSLLAVRTAMTVVALGAVSTTAALPSSDSSEVWLARWLQAGQPPVADLTPLAAGAFAALGGERWGARLQPQWSADLEYEGILAGMKFTDGRGSIYYDRTGKRRRMNYTAVTNYFRPKHPNPTDDVAVALRNGLTSSNLTWGIGDGGVCTSWPTTGTPYMDMFVWVPFARPRGRKMVLGQPCEVFVLSIAYFTGEVCVGADRVPREINQSYTSAAFGGYTWLRFANVRIGNPGNQAFETSLACAKHYPREPCPSPVTKSLNVYRIFGQREPLELNNRDAGDILGDLAFVCTQGSGQAYEGKLITHWRVNLSTAFGQYALCNFNGFANFCSGTKEQLLTVGRRSGQFQGVGELQGQCSPNDDVGSQFSFPLAAKCLPGVDPAPAPGAGCAWSAVAVKTVEAHCIMQERGLLAECAREVGHAPFRRSAAIWAKAFEYEDPASGGCPGIRGGAGDSAREIVV